MLPGINPNKPFPIYPTSWILFTSTYQDAMDFWFKLSSLVSITQKIPEPYEYTITASADANGTINPSGLVVKGYGTGQQFNANPSSGYEVDKWYVDGNSVQTGGVSYKLSQIHANHTVHVTFNQSSSFTITASSGANGTVDPNGAIQKAPDSSQTFTAIANADAVINKWYLDGNPVQTGGAEFILSNIQASHTVNVSFCLKADFNKDYNVDTADLITFSQHWLSEDPNDICNLNGIGIVDFEDLSMFAEKWMNIY